MTTMTATIDSPVPPPRRWALLLVGTLTAAAVLMFLVGALVTQWVAGGHGQFHALFALAFLVPALILAIRRPAGGWASTPVVIGFAVLAVTQIVEGVGGFGYDPSNDVRVNLLAQVHDVGLVLSPLGLIAGAAGLVGGVAQLLRRRLGLVSAIVAASLAAVGLGFLVKTIIGF